MSNEIKSENTTKYFICCYNENKDLEHFPVSKFVYDYIRQLENEIKYSKGDIQKLYDFRFFKPLNHE